jgi:signal transduction histidine kinase
MIMHFLGVWPVVESILQAFANATGLPIFVYLNDACVFHSPVEMMPPLCRQMLNSDLKSLCIKDGARRANKEEPEYVKGVQLCHAGMANGWCEIPIMGIGRLTILYGAKKARDEAAEKRRASLLQSIGQKDAQLADGMREADESDSNTELIEDHDSRLMGTISDIIQQLFKATVGFRYQAIKLAHELALTMIPTFAETQKMEHLLQDFERNYGRTGAVTELLETGAKVISQCRFGLYIVRNFLSDASEKTYKDVVRPQFSRVDIGRVLTEMIDLHQQQAIQKDVHFDAAGVEDLPAVKGSAMEIGRLFYNILNNAIKYSYHSTSSAKRVIKINTKVPYDPGFQERRFSILIENYGLGVTAGEIKDVFKSGFRGSRAIEEVVTGSGIGLSEALKIMRAHGGKIKFRSAEKHRDDKGKPVYLTSVELIFPYYSKSGGIK